MRELVYDFYGSRYAACLARLQRLLPMLRLDLYLSPHVDTLYAAVRPLKSLKAFGIVGRTGQVACVADNRRPLKDMLMALPPSYVPLI